MTIKTKIKICQLEEYSNHLLDPEPGFIAAMDGIFYCTAKAKHTMIIKEGGVGHHRKMVFRLCDTHLKLLRDNSHSQVGCHCTTHSHYLFRENKL